MRSTTARRAAAAALFVGSVVGFSALAGIPSYAVTTTIPQSESLYSVTCDNGLANAQVLSIDSGTGASTELGQGNSTFTACPWNAQWDAATKTAYFQTADGSTYTVDPATGKSVYAFTPNLVGTNIPEDYFSAFAISPEGDAYGLVWVDDNGWELAHLDLSNGALDLIGAIDASSYPEGDPQYIFSIDFDPVDGNLYGISRESGNLYQFDLTSGAVTQVGSIGLEANDSAYGLQFDSTGTLWFLDVALGSESDLSYATLPVGDSTVEPTTVGPPTINGTTTVYSYSLLLTPAAAQPVVPPTRNTLATTGVNPLPGELAALILVTVGSSLWGASRLHRRRRSRPSITEGHQ